MNDGDGNDGPAWRLLLHGRPRLQAVAAPSTEIALTERDAAWLALVALGGGLVTARVAGLAWARPGRSSDPDKSPLVNLRQRVFRLRETARRLGTGDAPPRLVTLGGVPALAPDLTWQAPSEDALRDDPSAWDDELLGRFAYDDEGELTSWVALQRNAFAQRRRDVLTGLAADAEQAGELARALRFALQLQRHEPLSENLLRRVMRLHHRRGDAPAAIAAVETAERLLRDEVGVRLSPETADLLRTIETAGGPAACVVQARLGDAMVPYAVARKLMQALGRPSADSPKVRFGDAESALVDARGRGLPLQVVDDLHYADRASIELLCALAGANANIGLPWLLAHRPIADADDDAAMLRALAEAPQVRWLEVAPLAADDLTELLASLDVPGLDAAALAPKLWRQGGGNPLYALETLRAMQAAGSDFGADALPKPQAVSRLIGRRLARLSPRALALARVAAIAVPDFSTVLAEKALGEPAAALADAWAELEGAGVLHGLGFAHDPVHDEVRQSVPKAIGEHLHALVAEHLSNAGAEAARLAPHWVGAARWHDATEALMAAAKQAERSYRTVEAGRLLWQAAGAWQRAGNVPMAAEVGAIAAMEVAYNEAGDAAGRMSTVLEEWIAGDTSLAAWPVLVQALQASVSGRHADADALATRASTPAASSTVRILATVVRAVALSYSGRNDDAVAAMEAVRRMVDGADDTIALRYWGNYGTVLLQGQHIADGREAVGRALELARRLHSGDEIPLLLNLSAIALQLGDAETTIALALDVERRISGERATSIWPAWNRLNWGVALAASGRYTEALVRLEPAAPAFAALHLFPEVALMAENCLALLYLQLGQTARALMLARKRPTGLPDHRLAERLLIASHAGRAIGENDAPLLREAVALCDAPAAAGTRLLIEIALVRHDHPGIAGLGRLRDLAQNPLAQERAPIALLAGLEALGVALSAAPDTLDADVVAALEARVPQCHSLFLDLPHELHRCARAWRVLGRPVEARRALDAGLSALMHAARHTVPEPFVRSYLAYPAHAALTRDAASF